MLGNFQIKVIISSMFAVFLLNGCGKPKNLVERNGVWYEVNSQEPYTGDYTLTKSAEVNGQEKQWTAEEGYIRDGKFDGDFTFIGINGDKIHSEYSAGILNGKLEMIAENGQTIEKCNYKNGKINGQRAVYWPNGQTKFDCEFIDGFPKSACSEYNSNGAFAKKTVFILGKMQQLAVYKNNDCKVEAYYYDQNGKLLIAETADGAGDDMVSFNTNLINAAYYSKEGDGVDFKIKIHGKCISMAPYSPEDAQKIHEQQVIGEVKNYDSVP